MSSGTEKGPALTVKELAAYLNISMGSAYTLMHAQGFPSFCVRPGKGRGIYRVFQGDLLGWLAEQSKGGAA